MQERWAVLLREEPSSKDYREAVSSKHGCFSSAKHTDAQCCVIEWARM